MVPARWLSPYLELPRTVRVLSVGMFVNRAGSFVVPFLALYLSEARGHSPSLATTALGVFGVGAIVAAWLGGRLADAVGRRVVMIAALVGGAAGAFVLPLLAHPVAVLAAVLGMALASESYRPAAQAMITDLTPPEQRPRAFALLYVAVNLGFAFGAAVGGWLAARSFTLMFWGDAATSLAFALVILSFVREGARPRPRTSPDPGGPPEAGGASAPAFGVFLFACFLAAFVFTQAMSTFPLVLERLAIGPELYGRIMAVNGILIAVGQLPLAHLVSGWDRARVLSAGSLLMALGFGLHGLAERPLAFAGAVAVWTVGEMLNAALAAPVVGELAPPSRRGRFFGAHGMTFGAAMVVGPPVGGLVLERWGSGGLWAMCAVAGFASALLLWGLGPTLRAAARASRWSTEGAPP